MNVASAWPAVAIVAGCLLVGALPRAVAGSLEGKVTRVIDGDTIEVLNDQREVRVRLADIDAPELHQPYGLASKQTLSGLIFGRVVHVEDEGADRYGRMIGLVSIGSIQINQEMVRIGAAWVFPEYNSNEALPGIEAAARASKAGLWADDAIPPWEFRCEHRPGGFWVVSTHHVNGGLCKIRIPGHGGVNE